MKWISLAHRRSSNELAAKKRSAKIVPLLLCLFNGCLIGCLILGCYSDYADSGPQSSADGIRLVDPATPKESFAIERSSEQILKQVIDLYSQASSYRDQAVLHLNYRLLGKSIQEPHPFDVTWQSDHQLASRIFKGQLSCDGKLMTCYVYDILSGNLDGQQLFVPVESRMPLTQLYEDSIVRHYLGGYADLPLDETRKNEPPRLIPPTLSLLSKQLPFGWLQSPTASQRLPDQTVNGKNCFVVRSMFDEMTADIWIDQQTGLLVQISMPLKVMDRQVLTTGEIEDVELTIKFHDAQINVDLDDQDRQRFAVALKNRATPVRRFVKVPDPFPSQRIGEMVPKFDFRTPQGKTVDRLFFDGRPALLLWVSGMDRIDETLIPKLVELVGQYPQESIRIGLVYSDTELSAAQSIKPSQSLLEIAERHQIPLYFDQELQVAAKFQLKPMPAAVILDPNSRLEFVRSLSDDQWSDDLRVAFQRTVRGERIAEEMRGEYEKFMTQYHQQLDTVSAHGLLGMAASKIAATDLPAANVSGSLKPVIAWKNDRRQRPGNLLIDPWGAQPRLYAMDGWRTVVELDLTGEEIGEFQLELPPQAAVSCLRIIPANAPASADQPRFAAFTVQGDRVYLFNADWKLLTMLPAQDFPHDGIRDVQFLAATDDSASTVTQELVVAFTGGHGCYRFNLDRKEMSLISPARADSLAIWQDQVYYANADGFGLLAEESESPMDWSDLMFQRLLGLETLARQVPGFVGVTLVDRENNWSLARIDDTQQLAWRQPVGSQLFEREIEPIAAAINADGQILVAVADASHRVTFISGDGQYFGQFTAPDPLTGIAMFDYQGVFHLVIATENAITGYRLTSASVPAIQVSHPQEK